MPSRRPLVAIAFGVCTLVALYFGGAALLLRLDLDAILFPRTPPLSPTVARGLEEAFRVEGAQGEALVAWRFGEGEAGCVVYFPGEPGGVEHYARQFYGDVARAGLVVYAIAYPGEDGAPGRAVLADMPSLAAQAVARVATQCGAARTVLAGRSLGALIAAWSSGRLLAQPAGLVLESASPSLVELVRAHLREHPLSRPLASLPLRQILGSDPALADMIPAGVPAVVFQGSADPQSPIEALRPAAGSSSPLAVVEVPDGTHADTFVRAKDAMIARMLEMIGAAKQAHPGRPS
jgi:alpha-beta hydrolase superfamily lysophospholipase